MTESLELALQSVRRLPADRQDALAQLLFDEIDSEEKWNQRFESTSEKLESLAQRALDNDRGGRSVNKGWDEL